MGRGGPAVRCAATAGRWCGVRRDEVLRKAWQNPTFRAVRRTAQALFAQLVTQGAPNIAGVLPLMPAKWAAACDEVTEAGVMADLAILSTAGVVVVDPTTFEVLIRGFIRDCGAARHASQFQGALKCSEAVESVVLRTVLARELQSIGHPDGLALAEILSPSTDLVPTDHADQSDKGSTDLAAGSEVGGS